MSLGTLEAIAEQLTALNANFAKHFAEGNTSATPAKATRAKAKPEPAPAVEPEVTPEVEAPAPEAKAPKAAAKKVAAKKVAAKKKGADLSDITTFKKRLFEVAEATKVAEVMPKLKAFIKSSGYASSDEIEVDDREEFVESVTAHFEELKSNTPAEAGDDSDFDL